MQPAQKAEQEGNAKRAMNDRRGVRFVERRKL
jgi:hypothetical protein